MGDKSSTIFAAGGGIMGNYTGYTIDVAKEKVGDGYLGGEYQYLTTKEIGLGGVAGFLPFSAILDRSTMEVIARDIDMSDYLTVQKIIAACEMIK